MIADSSYLGLESLTKAYIIARKDHHLTPEEEKRNRLSGPIMVTVTLAKHSFAKKLNFGAGKKSSIVFLLFEVVVRLKRKINKLFFECFGFMCTVEKKGEVSFMGNGFFPTKHTPTTRPSQSPHQSNQTNHTIYTSPYNMEGRVKRLQYKPEQLQAALDAWNSDDNSDSVFAIAKRFGIPNSTVSRHVDNQVKRIEDIPKSGPGTYLNAGEEKSLLEWIQSMQLLHTPVGKREVASMVSQIMHDPELKKLSKSWWRSFHKRNEEFGWKNTEKLDKTRVDSSSINAVTNFFSTLKEKMATRKYSCIWNMDETAVNGEPLKNRRVLIDKRLKIHYDRCTMTSDHVTMVAAINNLGGFIPPMLIFKGKRLTEHLGQHAPTGESCDCC